MSILVVACCILAVVGFTVVAYVIYEVARWPFDKLSEIAKKQDELLACVENNDKS